MRRDVVWVVQVILVVRRVFRSLEDKVLEPRAEHFTVQFAADGQHGVANTFGIEKSAIHSPEELVSGVDLPKRRDVVGGLSIGVAGDNPAVQFFQRLTAVTEFAC